MESVVFLGVLYRVSGVFRRFSRVSGVFRRLYRVGGVFRRFYTVGSVFIESVVFLELARPGAPGARVRSHRAGLLLWRNRLFIGDTAPNRVFYGE